MQESEEYLRHCLTYVIEILQGPQYVSESTFLLSAYPGHHFEFRISNFSETMFPGVQKRI